MTKLRPINNKIIVKPISKNKLLSESIIVLDNPDEKFQVGEIMFVCDEMPSRLTTGVKPGDNVLFSKFVSKRRYIKFNDQTLIIMNKDDPFARIRK